MSSGVPAIDVIVAIAAGVTAIGVIWRKALRPIIHAAHRAEEALPVVLNIAQEFQANGGSSLRDTIENMAADNKEELAVLSEYTHTSKHALENKLAVFAMKQDLLTENVAGLGAGLSEVKSELEAVKSEVAEVKEIVGRSQEEAP